MNVQLCKSVCKQCPFRTENSHQLNMDEVKENFMDERKVTPCHQEMVQYTGIANRGVEQYAKTSPVFKVCRGMVISRLKSGAPVSDANILYNKMYDEVFTNKSDRFVDIVEIEL